MVLTFYEIFIYLYIKISMKLKKWSKSDDEILIKNKNYSIRDLSELLQRSIPSIKNRKKN